MQRLCNSFSKRISWPLFDLIRAWTGMNQFWFVSRGGWAMSEATPQRLNALTCLLGIGLTAMPGVALAVTCQVPADRPTIQAAVDDPACTDIVLVSQVYTESVSITRSLLMFGPDPAQCLGRRAGSTRSRY
jgi:hypothetical protein